MSGPWERYQQPATTGEDGPWSRYGGGRAAPGKKLSPLAAAGLGALDGVTFGWGDEIAGVINEDAKWALRDLNARAQDEQGGWYLGGQIGSSLIPAFGAARLGGAGLAAAGRAVGALPLAARMSVGAGIGAASGAVGGAGRANDGERASGAVSGAAFGAGLGAAAPVIAGGLSRVMGAMRTGPTPMAQAVASGKVNPNDIPFPTDLNALDDFIRVMDRSPRRSVEDLTTYVDEALGDPGRGRTFVDALEAAGEKRMKMLYKTPGRTADAAETAFQGRASGQRQRLEKELLGRAGLSSLDAEKEVARLYDEVGAEYYKPVLEAPLGRAQLDAFYREVEPLARNRWFQKALDKGDELLANDILLGKLPPTVSESLAHKLHYTKLAFDTLIGRMKRSSEVDAAAGTELRQLVELKQRYLKALDPHNPFDPLSPKGGGILPGYSVARKEFGGIVEADDAIEQGRAVFRPGAFRTPDHLRDYTSKLGNFERQFFLAGVEDELARVMGSAGQQGRRNVAASLLRDGTLDRLGAIFPENTMRRIKLALTAEDDLFRRGSRARGGSDTATALSEMMEQGGAVAGSTPMTLPGLAAEGWRQSGGAILKAINAAGLERRNDDLGRMLLMQLDDPETAPQVKVFLAAVADRVARRALNERSMLGQAAGTGMVGGAAGFGG